MKMTYQSFVVKFSDTFSYKVENDHFENWAVSEKTAMDELKFLWMIASNGALGTKQIGTFLHYLILNAAEQGSNQYFSSILSKVKSLLSNGEVDHLLMTKFFGLNDFKNLDFLEPYELTNEFYDLIEVNECYNKLVKSSNQSMSQELEPKKSDNRYMSASPCLSLKPFPECKAYCNWHQKMTEKMSTLEIDAFER